MLIPILAALTASAAGPDDSDDLARRATELMVRYCVECHAPGPGNKKAQNWIEDVRDHETWVPDWVEIEDYRASGDLADVSLWVSLTDPDPDIVMPPPDSEAGSMSLDELALVRWWIDAGAPLPAVEPADDAGAAEGGAAAPSAWVRWRSWTGRLHPMVAHFPIALLLFAGLAGALGSRSTARWCVHGGAASAVAAAGLGWLNALDVRGSWMLETHRWLGLATALCALLLAWLVERDARSEGRGIGGWTRVAWCACALAVGATGFFGGSLIHGLDHLFP
ncbi:MAG: hypothetical protein QF903_07555 [Planctomycetota bacterium]|nr:hypothetical protein [Planctomycetota bacterium]MDP6761933.1 hypothetical protein [Planctomycetota bacterium]MDP6989322.1 hypothetical protein [Planctomycetota bacterium]